VIAGSANDDELKEATRRLPNGKLITIETGHWIHETQPEAFVKTIRTFFEN
jgi:pimeloyl-ACP methyl ester carboxylesterase